MAKTKCDYQVQIDNGTTATITASSQAQADAIGRLKAWLKPGDKVWCILRHRSASGMLRVIQIVKMESASERFSYLGYNAATALGWRYSREHEGVKVQGCGMDMGFHLVYTLSSVLFGDGYALKSEWL